MSTTTEDIENDQRADDFEDYLNEIASSKELFEILHLSIDHDILKHRGELQEYEKEALETVITMFNVYGNDIKSFDAYLDNLN